MSVAGPNAARNAALWQASCVAIAGRGVLIEGPPGSGKSSLALALIDRGAALVGDDGVRLEMAGDTLWAHPVPATAGLLEIRNVGLVTLPSVPAWIALVLRLDPGAPRYVEEAESAARAGVRLPLIRLWPDTPALPLRAEWALRLHGLAASQ
ncbi:HPr kinase/phosphatase C-terminal domain-containing protein [Croceibacterium sp. TMG7-5b_MA50]|uniref:HPr kinase/phosphorylase n=1 Tax=Croceibacterium sp. TMG7-5b_MA50 TaxID=3121290 RepID=UPI0032214694